MNRELQLRNESRLARSRTPLDYRTLTMVTDRLPLRIPDSRLPLLVTGISGVAGLNTFAFLRRRYGNRVFGQRPVVTSKLNGPGIIASDLEDANELRSIVREHGIRSILNTGGSCNLKGCELDHEMARRVNVSTVRTLVDASLEFDTRFVHLSIDLVFGGIQGGDQREMDAMDPVTMYGKTMAEAEAVILAARPDACIGRISLPMGVSFNSHAGAIDWIGSRFAAGRLATLYYDELRTPTYVECLAEVCEDLVAGELAGIWHLGGPRAVSLNEIAQIVNRVGGYDPDLLRGCYRIEAGPIPPRAGNVTMDSSAIAGVLGRQPFCPWPGHEELVPDGRDWHYDRAGFPGNPELIRKLLYSRPVGF